MITKAQRREPYVAAPQILSALILALNAALEFQREYPREMALARPLFKSHERELMVMLGEPESGVRALSGHRNT